MGRRPVHSGLQRLAPRHQQPVRAAQPRVPLGADGHVCAAARARTKYRCRAAKHPAGAPRRRPHRRATDPGAHGSVDARRGGLLGSGVRRAQPRSAERGARAGAHAGREQPASGHAGHARAHRRRRGADPGVEVSAGRRLGPAGAHDVGKPAEAAHPVEPISAGLESAARAGQSHRALGAAAPPR